MQVASGKVSDRPFARTVYTLGARRFSGDFVLRHDGREYRTSWDRGRVVAALSPAPADTPGRLALKAGLVTSSVINRVLQELAERPGSDPVDLLALRGRLRPEQVLELRRQWFVHQAARMFALPDADFTLDNVGTLRAAADLPPLDPRALIYFGLRAHYSLARLQAELSGLGDRPLSLGHETAKYLPAFGFLDADAAILERLRERPHTVRELLDAAPDGATAATLAVVYALVAADCLGRSGRASATPTEAAGEPAAEPSATPAARTSATPAARTSATPAAGTSDAPAARTSDAPAAEPRTAEPSATPAARTSDAPAAEPRTAKPSAAPKTVGPAAEPKTSRPSATPAAEPRTARPSASSLASGTVQKSSFVAPRGAPEGDAAAATVALIEDKLALVASDASYYALLGVSPSAPEGDIRGAYFQLAKRLHPDRLRALGVGDRADGAQQLFAAINRAFGTLNSSADRLEYDRILAAGGIKAVEKAQRAAEEMASRIFAAEDKFRIGEMALRRNQFTTARDAFAEAVGLNPDEGEYYALLGWSTWCTAEEKGEVVAEVRRHLEVALAKAPRNVNSHFYRGKVEEQLGELSLARESYRRVLELQPEHHEAELAVRLLSSRRKEDSHGAERGLFGRKKR